MPGPLSQVAAPRAVLIWGVLLLVAGVPLILSTFSPLLAWRDPIYIIAGAAGVAGLSLMVFQPVLAAGALPGVGFAASRRAHRWVATALVGAVIVHVGGLWLTSPPDVIDALLFRSPTPFAVWGVLALIAIGASAVIALCRRPLRIRWKTWRWVHSCLAFILVLGTILHAILIQGTMEPISKALICGFVFLATVIVLLKPLTNFPKS